MFDKGGLYTKDGRTLILCSCHEETFVLREETENLVNGAFNILCQEIRTFDLSNSNLKSIDCTFYPAMSYVEAIILPDSIESITEPCFSNCGHLKSIKLPTKLSSISATCLFRSCASLETIDIPASIDKIDIQCFANCSSLEAINFLGDIKTIEKEAFDNCMALKTIAFSKALSKIGKHAFYGNKVLSDLDYSGTKEDWERIEKDEEIFEYETTIHCVDGNIVYNPLPPKMPDFYF